MSHKPTQILCGLVMSLVNAVNSTLRIIQFRCIC